MWNGKPDTRSKLMGTSMGTNFYRGYEYGYEFLPVAPLLVGR
jgi:hypothetical protein